MPQVSTRRSARLSQQKKSNVSDSDAASQKLSPPSKRRRRNSLTSSDKKVSRVEQKQSSESVNSPGSHSPDGQKSQPQPQTKNKNESEKKINSTDPRTGPIPPLNLYPDDHRDCPWAPSHTESSLIIVTWNVASMRTVVRTGALMGYINLERPDILCIQETKMTLEAAETLPSIEGYTVYWNHSEKKGYSGVATLVKNGIHVKHVETGMGLIEADTEGRVLVIHVGRFAIVNAYVPNSGGKLSRLDFRTKTFEPAMRTFLNNLRAKGPVLYCGDLNVAHRVIDIHNSKGNQKSAGHTPEERKEFGSLLESDQGWTDVYRNLYPESPGYTYYSRRFGERLKRDGKGWRLDYFVVDNESYQEKLILDCFVRHEIGGSDHVPVVAHVQVGYWKES